jgi:propanol-preferring alcohol dehydrogenase
VEIHILWYFARELTCGALGDWAVKAAVPVVGGHEGVGTVVAIGEHTQNSTISVGNRVGIKWTARNCVRCESCQQGSDFCCDVGRASSSGYRINGTFCQYLVSYVSYVTPIPEGLESVQAAPFLCAGLTVYKALKRSNTTIGNWVAISGAGGGLGHLAVQIAVAMGLRVIAIDTGEEKRKLVTSLGAEKWVDFQVSGANIIQDIMLAADGKGPHAAVIAAGNVRLARSSICYETRSC